MPQHTPDKPRPIVILGPTAGGKSELAVLIAERLPEGGQILGADSMQVYRHLDAGTAKPEPELRARVRHHLIDLVEPTERFTVADWLARAEQVIAELQARGVRPIVVGGTNLYLKVLLEGMFDAPAPGQAPGNAPGQDLAFRAELEKVPAQELHRRLQAVDPVAAERIHPNNHKRIVRALEVHHLTGQPISAQQRQWSDIAKADRQPSQKASADDQPPPYRHNPILIGLHWPTEQINRRINARVKAMFHPEACGLGGVESLPDEVRRLEIAGLLGQQAREALGYKQVLEHLHGHCSLEEAFEQTKIQTRRFAKQQRTWLRRHRNVQWLHAAEHDLPALAQQALAEIRRRRDQEIRKPGEKQGTG